MEYLHIKNLEKYHPEIKSEAHLEKFLLNNWEKFFNIDFIATREKISKRSIIDILAKKDNEFFVIELKFRPLRTKDKKQLKRYIKDFSKDKKEKVNGILIGYNHKNQEINAIYPYKEIR